MTATAPAIQMYRVYIKATPEKIWEAITDPEWTNQYGYTGYTHFEPLEKGGTLRVVPNEEFKAGAAAQGYPCPDPIIDGEVLEADPFTRLVTTWRFLMVPTMAADAPTTLTYDIMDLGNGSCRLTLTHDCTTSPETAEMITGSTEDEGAGGGGGWAWVLSDLKSLIETGSPLAG